MKNINNTYDIFISWHDDKNETKPYSFVVGQEYKKFIEYLFDGNIRAFFSGTDTNGEWRDYLKNQMQQCDYAVFLITDKTIGSGWVHAEYGAFMMKGILMKEQWNDDVPHICIISERKEEKGHKIDGIIKDSQLFFGDAHKDNEKALFDTYKAQFKKFLEGVLTSQSASFSDKDFYIHFDKNFDNNFGIFRERIDFCKRSDYQDIEDSQKCHYKPLVSSNDAPVLATVKQDATPRIPTSIDDIDFERIDFSYTKPDNKVYYGRDTFVKNLHKCFESGKNCLNVVATGGMGKTSVAYIYIDKFRNEYQKIQFVTSNDNITNDFNSELRKRITNIVPSYDSLLKSQQDGGITEQIDRIMAKATGKCLLVVDVNIDEEGLDALKLNHAKSKWHILYLSRKRIDGTYNDVFKLPNFEGDMDGAKGLFNSIYANEWDDDKLKSLFKLVYYHPLLIEHLAAYGRDGKSYDDLCDVVSESRIKNATINKRYSKYSTCFVDKECTKDVCVYLSQLFVFDQYNEDEKYLLQHFIMWPYDYISKETILSLLKSKSKSEIEGALNDLTDKVVFSQSEKGYRMHGLLGDTLKDKSLIFDYTVYIRTICGILDGDEVYGGVRSCLSSTPIELFVEEKYLPLYKQYGGLLHFLKSLSGIRGNGWRLGDGWALDFAYKAELLCRYYKYGDLELSQKLLGEYKDKSSYHVYYDWLETQKDYDATLPDDGIVKIEGSNCKFKMIKVDGGEFEMGGRQVRLSDYYIGETQVTQELYRAITKRNPSNFNENKLKRNTDNHPVERVSWFDCLEFLMLLNKRTGLKFRFPTEVQWEFAARGGQHHSPYKYSGSDKLSDVAWYGYVDDDDKNRTITEQTTMPVAQKNPNDLGIYDMSGNVYEWCQDWYDDYNSEPQTDPTGPSSGSSRVLRGGSWGRSANGCRVSYRSSYCPDGRFNNYGMRLALPCSPFPS